MSKTISEVIAELQEQIVTLESQSNALKRKVNDLCPFDGIPEVYSDISSGDPAAVRSKIVRLRPDEFTPDKLMKAMKRYLEMRKAADPDNAPARVEEIVAALREGNFRFRDKEPLSAVSISLGKSSHTFHRLGNGQFGLNSWYGIVSRPTKSKPGNGIVEDDDGEDAEEDVPSAPIAPVGEPTANPNCNGGDREPAKVEMTPQ